MFERPQAGEKAVLVHLRERDEAPDLLEEFRSLADSAGAITVGVVEGVRKRPDPRYFIGSGKVEELKGLIDAQEADLAIFDHALTPSQERNLERVLQCRVLDRTGLILDIFAQRARSFEGKLQVELAQLRHLSTRLVRGWTHLERQKGGIGLRGPGETQLETDRRLLAQRIRQLNGRLEKVDGQREQGRRSRRKAELPILSLVGYTNAGKSTLFNRLTGSGVYAADQLFATLDPTLRRIELPGGASMILADTVGFVSRLPHDLVAAFRSTLRETTTADLLLHVIDAASPARERTVDAVDSVLEEIGAAEVPRIEIMNKIDRLEDAAPRIERNADGAVHRVWLSARTGDGIELLRAALAERFRQSARRYRLRLAADEGRLRARLFASVRVVDEHAQESGGWELTVEMDEADRGRLAAREPALRRRLEGESLAPLQHEP